MAESDRNNHFRLFAYFGGPLIVEAMTAEKWAREVPLGDSALTCLENTMGEVPGLRALFAAACLPISKRNAVPLLKLALRLQRARRKRSS